MECFPVLRHNTHVDLVLAGSSLQLWGAMATNPQRKSENGGFRCVGMFFFEQNTAVRSVSQSNQSQAGFLQPKNDAATSGCQACVLELAHQPPLLAGLRLGNRNCRASSDHRPDASIPKTTNRALARGSTSSGYLLSFRHLVAVTQSADNGRIDCELRSTEQWQPVNCNFESSCVHLSRTRTFQIQISYQDVRGDAPARLTANARCCAIQSNPPLAQHPCTCASCPVMAKDVAGGIKPGETARRAWTMQLLRQFLLGSAPKPGMLRSSWETDPSRGKIDGL